MANDDTQNRILDAAETRAQQGGYNAFSFRELAGDVGIKSSSIHYHFPTKEALSQALVRRYFERTRDELGDPVALGPAESVARLTAIFRRALIVDDRMCLCGLFGAERDALPASVNAAVADYFKMILGYLAAAFAGEARPGSPEAVLARLEGGLILARSLGDRQVFEQAIMPPSN